MVLDLLVVVMLCMRRRHNLPQPLQRRVQRLAVLALNLVVGHALGHLEVVRDGRLLHHGLSGCRRQRWRGLLLLLLLLRLLLLLLVLVLEANCVCGRGVAGSGAECF